MAFTFDPIINGEAGYSVREKLNTSLSHLLDGEGSFDNLWEMIKTGAVGRQYLHIRFSSIPSPTDSSQISTVPNNYMGITLTSSGTAPEYPSQYVWFRILAEEGTGSGGTGSFDIDILTTASEKAATDSNLMSSKRIITEIANAQKDLTSALAYQYLSKQEDDSAYGRITFYDGILVSTTETSTSARTVLIEAVTEIGCDVEELTENFAEVAYFIDTYSEVAGGVQEITAYDYTGGGSTTLGGLDNVEDIADSINDSTIAQVIVQEPGSALWIKKDFVATAGALEATMRLTALSPTELVGTPGMSAVVKFNFSSLYNTDNTETGFGTMRVVVNSSTITTRSVAQGDTSIDVSRYLVTGVNPITITITDAVSNTRTLSIMATVVALSLTSTFDATTVFTEAVNFTYIPSGEVEKTIHFILDGKEIGTFTTEATGRIYSFTIPMQTHGAHLFEVFITAVVDGNTIQSDSLVYAIMFTVSGNNTVIIASNYTNELATQYDTLNIPFIVYNPSAATTTITLNVNGTVVGTREVDRTTQYWSYTIPTSGVLSMKIAAGAVTREFSLTVTPSEITSEAATTGLELFLTASGRSNSDTNKSEWDWETIKSTLSNFNFVTDGWMSDTSGSTSLTIQGGASVEIPFKIFGTDFRSTGKVVEFDLEVANVTDFTVPVISCVGATGVGVKITAQEALLKSEQIEVTTKFKEDERVRVSFMIESTSSKRLVYTYINGIASGCEQYPINDNFQQANPVNITIGNTVSTVKIFNIRVYKTELSMAQMLDNYIADLDVYEDKLAVYLRNQVTDIYGDIDYNKSLEKIPCMTITGTLPTYKGDKKTVDILYVNKENTSKSFTSSGVTIDVQGTTSQYYPRKNYKMTHNNGFYIDGTYASTYKLRDTSIGVKVFTHKADFVESSSTHNTGWARQVDSILRGMGYLTPPMKNSANVRTTIDGFPILMFHKATEASTPIFLGKYNFNNDKATEAVFGFSGVAECWEFLNNTSDRVLFKASNFTGTDWLEDFEGRYPDGNTDPTNLSALCTWVVSTRNNTAKFYSEASAHFNIQYLLSYYIMTEFMVAADQRAKNMMFASWGNEGYGAYKWYPIFYDNDTILGLNNEGVNDFPFNAESTDIIGQSYIFNGAESVLWTNVAVAFKSEIAAMYHAMRVARTFDYDIFLTQFNVDQSEKWAEAVYNMDMKFKYIDPFISSNEPYLYALQGSRADHRKWFLFNRFRYMDSKWQAGDFLNDYVYMRLYTPQNWAGVAPNADFSLTIAAAQYTLVKYAQTLTGVQRTDAGDVVTVTAPAMEFNDTECYVYGASRISSLGDLSGHYAGSMTISAATALQELIIGNSTPGYQNNNMTSLVVGNNTLLKKINVQNCPSLKTALNLSNCLGIQEILAAGSGLTSVLLPDAGTVNKMQLPATITNLTVKNQSVLNTAGLTLEGYSNLSTLVVENSPNLNPLSIVYSCLSLTNPVLSRVRITGLDAAGANLNTLVKLMGVGGIDDNGNNTSVAVVTGKFYATQINDYDLARVKAAFPYLTITYGSIIPAVVTTLNYSSSLGETLSNFEVTYCSESYTISGTAVTIRGTEGTAVVIRAKATNHTELEYTFTITYNRSISLTLIGIPLRTITVTGYANGVSTGVLQGVLITTTLGHSLTTDSAGRVSFRSGEAFTATGQLSGYNIPKLTVGSATTNSTYTMSAYGSIVLVIYVRDTLRNIYVDGASVELGGDTKVTDDTGSVYFSVEAGGTHSFNVNYFGITESFSTTVGNSASNYTANITLVPIAYRPVLDGTEIAFTTTNLSSTSVYISNTQMGAIIDWGDGSADTVGEVGTNVYYYHTYPKAGFWNIKITNNQYVTRAFPVTSNLWAYWSIGDSAISGISFDICYYVVYIGEDVCKNDSNRTSLRRMFYGCNRLLDIEDEIFSSILSPITSVESMFVSCVVLKKLPKLPSLSSITGTGLAATFYACYLVEDFPDISVATDVTSLQSTFYMCRLMQVLPDIVTFPNLTNLNATFYGCIAAKKFPIFSNLPLVTTVASLFYGCTEITGVLDISSLPSLLSVSSLLNMCSSVTEPPLLPINRATITDMGYTFYRTGIEEYPDGYFEGFFKVTTVSYLFANSAIKKAPMGFMKDIGATNTQSYVSAERLLQGTVQLESVPNDLFKNSNSRSASISYAFVGSNMDAFDRFDSFSVSGDDYLFSEASGPYFKEGVLDSLRLLSDNNYHLYYAFSNCPDLVAVCLPKYSTKLSSALFNGSTKLRAIIVTLDTPQTLSGSFYGTSEYAKFYIMDDYLDSYKTATGWTYFADRMLPLSELDEITARAVLTDSLDWWENNHV